MQNRRWQPDRRRAFHSPAQPVRPFVVGRKNFLFCDSVASANVSANLYSLIETAKAKGIKPYGYLKRLFTELPQARIVEHIEALLPIQNIEA